MITGTDVKFDRVTIKTASTGHRSDGPLNTAGIHIGQALTNALFYTDDGALQQTGTFDARSVTIQDCIITGVTPDDGFGTTAGVYVEPYCDGVVIERNNIYGVRGGEAGQDFSPLPLYAAGVLVMGAHGVLIKDNHISYSLDSQDGDEYQPDGIGLRGTLILGDTVSPSTSQCMVMGNTIHGFDGYGIRNDGTANLLIGNTAWDNTLGKYGGSGTYAPVVSALGDPAAEGSNL